MAAAAAGQGVSESRCWCGNRELEEFSPDYLRCTACQTLVAARMPEPGKLISTQDESGFYGRDYYETWLIEEFGFPSLPERARADLPERCLYWLRTLLKYKLPPASLLELGSAHGGFVALSRWAGYEAVGLEVSPWLVEFARQTFQAPMLLGPVEQQALEPESLDAIALMDVLEHLPDPAGTMRHCLRLLKPDGILLIQTPCYPEGKSYRELTEESAPFLKTMVAPHHLYLFGVHSVRRFLAGLGAGQLQFEPALFPYDMFLVAGRAPLATFASEQAAERLAEAPSGRLVRALLDLDDRLREMTRRYREAEADRAARLEVIQRQGRQLGEAEGARSRNPLAVGQGGARSGMGTESGAAPPNRESGDREWRSGPFTRLAELARRLASQTGFSHSPAAGRPARLRRVVVDLTPVLPGGENGGAKIMTMELVRNLTRLARHCQFTLLTSAASHDELAALDARNVKRLCVLGAPRKRDARANEEESGILAKLGSLLFGRRDALGMRDLSARRADRGGQGLLRTLQADLLFCPFTAPQFYEPGVPLVSVVYDLQYLDHPEFFEEQERLARDRAFREACMLASRLVCISDYVRERVLREGLISPQRVRTVHIALARRLARPAEHVLTGILARYGLSLDGYLLYPANFWPHKNHESLLEAFEMYCARHPQTGLRLALTGAPGPGMERVRDAVARLGVADRVVVAGFLPDREFAALLYGSRAVIFPSLYEGWGMPVLEAMAAGKPVLASKLTSLPEAAGGAAALFDPRKPAEIAAAIERLERDRTWADTLARRGAARAVRFAEPKRMAAQYWELFQEALADPAGLPPAVYAVHADGWVGGRFEVAFQDGPPGRRLLVTVWSPPWIPGTGTTLFLPYDLGDGESLHHIPKSETATVERLLPEKAGCWQVLVEPVCELKALGISPDSRPLGCRILSAEIRYPDGNARPLELSSYGL